MATKGKGKAPPPPKAQVAPRSKQVAPTGHDAIRVAAAQSLDEALAKRRAGIEAARKAEAERGGGAKEASEWFEGGSRAVEVRRGELSVGQQSESVLEELGDAIVVVDVCPDAVNDTLDPGELYLVSELDGKPLESRADEATRCESCGRLFQDFSSLFSHQGRTCVPPEQPENPHPVQISFDASRQPLLESFLAANELHVTRPHDQGRGESGQATSGMCSFLVDLSLLQKRLQEAYFAEASSYNLEQWYTDLHEHTAKSVMVSLADSDCNVLMKLRAAWHIGSHGVDMETMRAFENLVERLQDSGWGEGMPHSSKYFVKTSMRSPKDAFKVEHQPDDPPHVRVRNEIAACAVDSARSAIDLLLKSKRVAQDISNYFKYRSKEGPSANLNIILRAWDESIVDSIEWRCFVVEGRLTVISQYHCYAVFPAVANACTEAGIGSLKAVRSCIACFHSRIHRIVQNCVGISSYVMDLATPVQDGVDLPVRLVEINPVHTSGAALFNWRRDKSLIFRGRSDGEIEMRIVRSLLS